MLIKSARPSAVWVLQVMKRTYASRQQEEILFATDTFYTGQLIARQINTFTDGKLNLFGTGRLTIVDEPHRSVVSKYSPDKR